MKKLLELWSGKTARRRGRIARGADTHNSDTWMREQLVMMQKRNQEFISAMGGK